MTSCGNPLSVVTLGLVIVLALGTADSLGQLPCEFRDSINISSGSRDAQHNFVHSGIIYQPKNYALISYDYVGYDSRVSVPDYYRGCVCQLANCVRLCCPFGQWFSSDERGTNCTETSTSSPFKVWVNVDSENGTSVTNLLDNVKLAYIHQKPCQSLYPEDLDEWTVDDRGSVQVMGETASHHEYCLAVKDDISIVGLHMCPLIEEAKVSYCIGIILSIPFLLATLLIYACIPELRNIHGKSLICYVLTLAIAYGVLLIMNFRSLIIPCPLQGYLLYFSVLACFFWLNVMCFDIFWTFSSGVLIKNERKRFLYYSLYAWGCPVLLLGTVLIIDYTELLPEEYRPRFGLIEHNCFIYRDKLLELIYFYLPLVLLVVVNLYFFVVTAYRIVQIQHATDVALRNDSGRHCKFEKDRYRFSLYLRLFIVMGVTWVFEILSWAVGSEGWFFYVSDICNCLLGVIIFFLFVWKQKVRQLVAKRIGGPGKHKRVKSTSANTGYSSGATKYTSTAETTVTMQATPLA